MKIRNNLRKVARLVHTKHIPAIASPHPHLFGAPSHICSERGKATLPDLSLMLGLKDNHGDKPGQRLATILDHELWVSEKDKVEPN